MGFDVIGTLLNIIFEKVVGLIGALFWQVVPRKGDVFDRVWKGVIEEDPETSQPKKVDLWALHQRGNEIKGRIVRIGPEHCGKAWFFEGTCREHSSNLVGYFWCQEKGNPSIGAINLIAEGEDDVKFKGDYLRYRDFEIRKYKLHLQKFQEHETGWTRLVLSQRSF